MALRNWRTMIATGAVLAAIAAGSIGGGAAARLHAASALDDDDGGAITARVRGTFQDAHGGLGVVSGDMFIVRFEVRNSTVTAIGAIVGAMADSQGNPIGRVHHELALPVANVASTCNQLRMELPEADAEVLDTPVHFDKQVAGYDSRDGMVPKSLGILCSTQALLRGSPTADALAAVLNDVVAAVKIDAKGRPAE